MDNQRFHMRKLALLIATCYAPGAIAAQAARIEFATSEPVIISTDGRERPARKGEAIVAGDRILTRAGRAQLAFADGAFVSLQPNTDFGVTDYHFTGKDDGSEKSVLSLVRGALRTVTGLIGRSRRDAYVMRTPTATIGIRGTGGRVEVNDRGTFVAGTSGTWFMSTPGGSVDIPAGSNGFAGPNSQSPPQRTSTGPSTPPASPLEAGFVAPDQVNSTGKAEVAPPKPAPAPVAAPVMADGAGYGLVYAYDSAGALPVSSTTATFASGGVKLASFIDSSYTQSVGGATVYEVGNDGIIGWGRWASGTVNLFGSGTALGQDEGMHYVIGVPTANMPVAGGAAYTLLGATNPTELSAATTPGTFSLTSLNVSFATSLITLGFNVSNFGGRTYLATSSMFAISGNTASGSLIVTNGGGGACATSCNGSVSGAFFGATAQRLGIVYKINDSSPTSYTLIGAAAFKGP